MDIDAPEVSAAVAQLGWPSLRPLQSQLLAPILEGQDVVAVLPTAFGKSALYQIPALCLPGLVMVISPLIALMVDQVARLRTHGVRAAALNSHVSQGERKRILAAVERGELDLLYVSPERMLSLDLDVFRKAHLQRFAVDEAHCISEWGHDFRPAYLKLGRSIRRLATDRKIPILALTATATPSVLDEIATILEVKGRGVVHRGSPDRPAVDYGVAGEKVQTRALVGRVEELVGLPVLVYGSTRAGVEEAAADLHRAGWRTAPYHADLPATERRKTQSAFMAGEIDVICATCAFGMGIDHHHLRGVVHLEMPTSLESYMQEAGRAGRDGQPSVAIVRATVAALDTARGLLDHSWPTPERIERFWNAIEPLFDERPGKTEPAGEFLGTLGDVTRALAIGDSRRLGLRFEDGEAGACFRVLVDCGAMERLAQVERPACVTLLSGATRSPSKRALGPKEKRVLEMLSTYADERGDVVGTVGWFRDEIELDEPYAKILRDKDLLRFTWAAPGTLWRRVRTGDPGIDADRVRHVRARSILRLAAAHDYLYEEGCRRAYLLRYFEASPTGAPAGRCCDRCQIHHSGSSSRSGAAAIVGAG
jgi:ATP-dependent DNA helicase RecQ